jgi:hypothetical protein
MQIKKFYIKFLLFIYNLIELIGIAFKSNHLLLNHKIKIGILLLSLKGTTGNAQYNISGRRCYWGYVPEKKNKNEIIISDRVSLKPLNNDAINLKFGYLYYWYSPGASITYNFQTNSMNIGPYVRLLTIKNDDTFMHFIEANYQVDLSSKHYNELNISTGVDLFYKKIISIDLAIQYTYSNNTYNKGNNFFRPIVGVHYKFRKNSWFNKPKSTENISW